MKTLLYLSLWIGLYPLRYVDEGNAPFSVGEQVYCHAPSGLMLRLIPSRQSEKIGAVLPDGQPLTVRTPTDPATRFVAETIGTFNIEGGWVKVRTAEGQEGYLFDGYLSRYPPCGEEAEDGLEFMESYYVQLSGGAGTRTDVPPVDGATAHYRRDYADGARFEVRTSERRMVQTLDVPSRKFSLQECLMLFRPIWFPTNQFVSQYDAATQRLTTTNVPNPEDGTRQLTIQRQGDFVRITFTAEP